MILSLDYTDRMLQKLWNPFRDWNSVKQSILVKDLCFKNSETLLGIETMNIKSAALCIYSFKNSETLLGIETANFSAWAVFAKPSFKNSETLLGIETNSARQLAS